MESTEVRLCSLEPPQAPAGSELCEDVQTETCTDSDGGTSGSVDHEKHIKKEEAEEEGYICEAASGPVGCITPVDHYIHVKKEEPEDEDSLCGEASSSVENIEQQDRGFQMKCVEMKCVKEEESDDEDYLCTTTVCEMTDAQFQVFSCSGCSLSYTSQIYLHKHIRRHHYEEYERLLKLGEIKDENLLTTRSSRIQDTVCGCSLRPAVKPEGHNLYNS
ncbi:hypothetical protein KOW79_019786 [Hemibagrus wyckioides]|uniref:C2H2-type domain-containing protein n=1 Tax=Hemibagrus wyckioides TaxID=337641 RepID=A0A9D3N837_9TELE|nr:hypothetical protein KOW79_019786 [Hemibagrus wyckioides]